MVLAAIILSIAAGCDARILGTQRISLTVTPRTTGAPVADAVVTCAPAVQRGSYPRWDRSMSDYVDAFSDESSTTDASGTTTITHKTLQIYGGLMWRVPSAPPDLVTGKHFYVRIDGSLGSETLTLLMDPGGSSSGGRYRATVQSIGPPEPRGDSSDDR